MLIIDHYKVFAYH